MTFLGSALIVGTTVAAEQVRAGEELDASVAFGAVTSRTLEVSSVHGGKVQAVMVGMQLAVPGIFYSLQLEFAEVIAVLKPDVRSMMQSGNVTWGIRGRPFKTTFTWMVVPFLVSPASIYLIDGVNLFLTFMFHARQAFFASFLA